MMFKLHLIHFALSPYIYKMHTSLYLLKNVFCGLNTGIVLGYIGQSQHYESIVPQQMC
jgi:hypothetical protein